MKAESWENAPFDDGAGDVTIVPLPVLVAGASGAAVRGAPGRGSPARIRPLSSLDATASRR
ncbi:hypothetical protein [Sorangium sp. So ce233]|uniref:hypothetical protein n=1 Tax=Sorangium sp. So ce233 TaxID=3133290 RepID=UPI003F645271